MKTQKCFSVNYLKKIVLGLVIQSKSHTKAHTDVLVIKKYLIDYFFLQNGKFYPLYVFAEPTKNTFAPKQQCNINPTVIKKFANH